MANLENVEKDKEDKSYYPEIAVLNFSMCFPSAFFWVHNTIYIHIFPFAKSKPLRFQLSHVNICVFHFPHRCFLHCLCHRCPSAILSFLTCCLILAMRRPWLRPSPEPRTPFPGDGPKWTWPLPLHASRVSAEFFLLQLTLPNPVKILTYNMFWFWWLSPGDIWPGMELLDTILDTNSFVAFECISCTDISVCTTWKCYQWCNNHPF